jgi:hypothetical protein
VSRETVDLGNREEKGFHPGPCFRITSFATCIFVSPIDRSCAVTVWGCNLDAWGI